MDLYAAFAVDTKLEAEGRWVTFGGTEEKPARALIASFSTPAYQRLMTAQTKSYEATLARNDDAAQKQSAANVDHAIATCILLKTENMLVKGVELASDYAHVRKVLAMPEMRELRTRIIEEAAKTQAYRLEQNEGDAKN
jgi:hypothetical protein